MLKDYRLLPMSSTAVVIILFDQLTKFLVLKNMELGESIPILGKYLAITSHRNQGAAWGMFQGQMFFFYLVTIVVLVLLVFIFLKEAKNNIIAQLAITFLIAGALGNFIDRILFQEVVDFIDVLIINYDFPIFNVADSFLTMGVILMIIEVFITGKGDKNGKHKSQS
jgi:signal peptidase II